MAASGTFSELTLAHDRFGFAFCIALALHAAFILGVSFNRENKSLASNKLEITLAQHRSKKAPEKADYLAQSDQLGSGTLEQKAMLTTRQRADYHDATIRDVTRDITPSSASRSAKTVAIITTTANSDVKDLRQQRQQQVEKLEKQVAEDRIAYQRDLEVASLEAKLDIQRHAYAKRPKIRRLTSVATKSSEDALYLHQWRTKIEMIGNQHYPARARQLSLYGDLRMVVSLLPNGEVLQVKVLKSSGHNILDQAAIKIVHLAAPYEPFPQAMRGRVDVLEIIRTWRFHKNRLVSSG